MEKWDGETVRHVLLVEDQSTLADSLARHLTNEGFVVTVAPTLADARNALRRQPAMIILDWMLPDGQGLDLLKELRREDDITPVLLLTARTDLVDKVVGLESGANDYITKPFEPRELIARLRAHWRARRPESERHSRPEPVVPKLTRAGIVLDETTREVSYRGQPVALTKMEYELVRLFLESPNRVFPRDTLLNRVWGYDHFPTTRTVDNHIAQLRAKFAPDLFETVRGIGYRFREAP